jgi:radical SAM protein with 4Fe4S-binding SPASM domain
MGPIFLEDRAQYKDLPLKSDLVPYFPLKLIDQKGGAVFYNPVVGSTHRISLSAKRVLELCNGERIWDEIVSEICAASDASLRQIARHVQPFLKNLTDEGALWWRSQPMVWSSAAPAESVFWNITGKCNLACRHCAVDSGMRQSRGLSFAKCRQIIDDMASFGIQDIAMSGGEPLARPDWHRLAVYARSCGLKVSLSTNGTLINSKIARQIAEVQADVQVSLDGATPEIHDGFRCVRGAWEQAVQGIRHLIKAGVPVTIGTTVTTMNIDQIPTICDLAVNLGAVMYRIIPFIPFGRGGHSHKLEVSPPAMRRLTEFLRKRRQKNDISISEMEFECTLDPPPIHPVDPQSSIGCSGARSYFTITESGEVLPCHFFGGVNAENVLESGLAWIWEHSRFLSYFRSLGTSDLTGACQACNWLPDCLGSCRAANFAHGHLLSGNVHCWQDSSAVRRAGSERRDRDNRK